MTRYLVIGQLWLQPITGHMVNLCTWRLTLCREGRVLGVAFPVVQWQSEVLQGYN